MKLLVVSHACARAANQQLYAGFQRQTSWDLTLLVPGAWRDEFGNRVDEPPCAGLEGKVLKVPVWMNGNIILHSYRFSFERFLEREQFDAIYLNHEPYAVATAQVFYANRRARKPAALGFYSCQNIEKRYPPPFRWMERFVYRQARFAFPITEAVAEVLKAKGYGGECAVAPLPIDLEVYRPHPAGEPASDVVTLGYVGRLTEAKGLGTLARALGRISHLAWRLVVIGSGPFQEEFDQRLEQAGLRSRVTYLGFVPHHETPRHLSAMDVLILPSETQPNWKEQFGRVIPEALACGTAVIGSDSGEIPRLIRESGGGLVFPERDVSALVSTMEQMISSPGMRDEMASQGRGWVMANLGLPKIAGQMAEVIARAVADRKHNAH